MKTSSATMFLGTSAALVAASSAFVAPMRTSNVLRPKALSASPGKFTMSAGSEYAGSLPGTPFNDGNVFDPLGLSDGASPGDIKRWREAEIKHGRVAMLASVGVLVAESFHPLFMGNSYIGPAVEHFQEISSQFPLFWVVAVAVIAFFENKQIQTAFAEPSAVTGEAGLKKDYMPGNLGFDPLGLMPRDEESLKTMQTKELNNGRLAMIGIAGMLVQELVSPTTILSFLG